MQAGHEEADIHEWVSIHHRSHIDMADAAGRHNETRKVSHKVWNAP
jgi:hypothetical protein